MEKRLTIDAHDDAEYQGGFFAFVFSMVFTLVFFLYVTLFHKGVDLKEVKIPAEVQQAETKK